MQSKLENTSILPIDHRAKLIGIDLATAPDKSVVRNLNKAQFFADKAQSLLHNQDESSVCNMVNAITTLAILNAEVLHIHIDYAAHVRKLKVRVNPANCDYSLLAQAPVLKVWETYVDRPDTLAKLKLLEDELIEFVGDAKDALMGAV